MGTTFCIHVSVVRNVGNKNEDHSVYLFGREMYLVASMSRAASRPVIRGILRFIMETERVSGWLRRIIIAIDMRQGGHKGAFPSHTQSGGRTSMPPIPKTLDDKGALPDYVRPLAVLSRGHFDFPCLRVALCKGVVPA